MMNLHRYKNLQDLKSRTRIQLADRIYLSEGRRTKRDAYWFLATFEDGEPEIYLETPHSLLGETEPWGPIATIEKVILDALFDEIEEREISADYNKD